METPRVSLGLPVYNGEQFLPAAIDSLLQQTYEDFELIISDNGSADATEAICREYARRDTRVRYYRVEENAGSVWNFNRTFELATGRYFKWAAHDDIHAPTFLEKSIALLDERPEVLWCFCRHSLIGPDGQVLTAPGTEDVSLLEPSGRDRSSPTAHERFASILFNASGLDCYGLMRREALARTHLYRPLYGCEKVLLGELAVLGQYAEIPETLFYLRVHPHASSSLSTDAELQQFVDPLHARRFSFVRWRLLKAHLATVRRSRLGIAERARCYLALGRYLLQVGKWARIVKAALRGESVGGGYRPMLDQLDAAEPTNAAPQEESPSRETIAS